MELPWIEQKGNEKVLDSSKSLKTMQETELAVILSQPHPYHILNFRIVKHDEGLVGKM